MTTVEAIIDPTAETPQATTGEITVSGTGVLIGMLTDLALTAETPSKTSQLEFEVIRLHTEGGRLHGWSSDRFRAAHAAVDADGSLPGPVNLAASDVANLAKAFRKVDALRVRVDLTAGTAEFSGDGLALTVSLRTMGARGLAELLSRVTVDSLPTSSSGHIIFKPAYLETVGKVGKRRGEQIRIVAGVHPKPAHLRIGDDYRMYLMPMLDRDPDAEWLPSVF